MRGFWFLSIFALSSGAVVAQEKPRPTPRERGDLAIHAKAILAKHCGECHGDTPKDNRLSVTKHDVLTGNAGAREFISLDKGEPRSQVLEFLLDGSMPPGGRPRPSAEEIAEIQAWVAAGAEAFPSDFNDLAVLGWLTKDFEKRGREEKQFIRYVSFVHLVNAPVGLSKTEKDLALAVGMNFTEVFTPVPDSAATLYRYDLRKVGWHHADMFVRAEFGKPGEAVHRMIPYDLIQLEYPYAHAGTAQGFQKKIDEAVAGMNEHRKGKTLSHLNAQPYLRGDWLTYALRRNGKPTPLANELAALADFKTGKIESIDLKHFPFEAMAEKFGVEPNPPIWAWYRRDVQPAKKPFIFNATTDTGGTIQPGGKPFKLSATSDKITYLAAAEIWSNNTSEPYELAVGAELAPDVASAVSPNAKGTISPAASLPGGGRLYLVVYAGENGPIRPPVAVRTRNKNGAGIWRLVPDEESDPKKMPTVRRVIELKVSE